MTQSKFLTPVSILVYTLLIALFLVIGRGHSFASSHCLPLLLMIEGGNASQGDGHRMEALVRSMQSSYKNKGNRWGITILSVDNNPFWNDYWLNEDAIDEAAQKIRASKMSPLVIVGHSLGAHTAWELARILPATLLVTLDGVSYAGSKRNLSHPGSPTKWLNIRAGAGEIDIFPFWNHQSHADRNYGAPYTHYRPGAIFRYKHQRHGSAKAAVDTALKCPPIDNLPPPDPKKLCDLDSVGCKVNFRVSNECNDLYASEKLYRSDVKLTFYEENIRGYRIGRSSITYRLRPGKQMDYAIRCYNPGHLGCLYGDYSKGGGRVICEPCWNWQPADMKNPREERFCHYE